jgi:hypothetical protein
MRETYGPEFMEEMARIFAASHQDEQAVSQPKQR